MSIERPTVMVSSTAFDLPGHRKQVLDACLRSGFAPHKMMEHLNAMNTGAIEASLEMVDKADVYIGIFAFRYGFIPDGADTSITEMEYQRAVDQKKPRLLFFMHDDHPITAKMVETGAGAEKLAALKMRAREDRVARFFKSPDELRGDVISALHELKTGLYDGNDNPAEAARRLHRRTPIPMVPTPYIAHPYTLSQTRDLVGRREELNALTDWVTKPGSPSCGNAIFCLVAIGGMGKSALTWKWFNEISPQEMPNLAGRLWWSFYEADAHFENFLNRALCYVGELSEDYVRSLPWQDREAFLLQHLKDKSYLLVLDGLERILLAYNRMDAGSFADDEFDYQTANFVEGAVGSPRFTVQPFSGQHRLRQTTDPRAGHFLRKLALVQNSKILISTRLFPLALQLPNCRPCPGTFPYFLNGLSDDDAVALWRALEVSGSRQELLYLFATFDSHPLLVQILAGEVARYRRSPGNFAAWKQANPNFELSCLPAAQTKSHILQHSLVNLSEEHRLLLTNIVALRMPATYDLLNALIVGENKIFCNEEKLVCMLSDLEDYGLIGWDREANRYDAHPIVRSVAWNLATPEEKEKIHRSLICHLGSGLSTSCDEANSLEEITIDIEIYHSLVELRRFDEAFSFFYHRLEKITLYKLSAHRERIVLLLKLFPNGTNKSPALSSENAQHFTYNSIAISYKNSGYPGLALDFYRKSELLARNCQDNQNRQNCLSNLSIALCEAGRLYEGMITLNSTLQLNRQLNDRVQESVTLECLGRLLNLSYQHERSLCPLKRSLRISGVNGDGQGQCVSTAFLAEVALFQRDLRQAHALAQRALDLAEKHHVERDLIRALLLKGRTALSANEIEDANELLSSAVIRAREKNVVEFELPALIAVAELKVKSKDSMVSQCILDDVWDAAEQGPYPLYQADAYNILADICVAEGDRPRAIEAATKAYRAAWCDGPPWAYHWGLEKAKAHLNVLGAPFPDMPPFDEAKFEPLHEVEINPNDEYCVDVDQPLEELLNPA